MARQVAKFHQPVSVQELLIGDATFGPATVPGDLAAALGLTRGEMVVFDGTSLVRLPLGTLGQVWRFLRNFGHGGWDAGVGGS